MHYLVYIRYLWLCCKAPLQLKMLTMYYFYWGVETCWWAEYIGFSFFYVFSTIKGICADHLIELYILGFYISLLSLIFVKIQPYFGLILHVWCKQWSSRNVLEVIAVIRNIMASCTDDLFQQALVKSLQRLDKAGLEIKKKQYEALLSVVRNKNDTSKWQYVL